MKQPILFVLALAATCAPAPARAVTVDPTAFSNKFYVTFSGYAGSTTLADFPVLVRLSAARNKFDYAACAANGADLRFADADGNLLSHEIDTWDTTGESLVWVKVPSFNADTVVTVYYGCANPPAVTASDATTGATVAYRVYEIPDLADPMRDAPVGNAASPVQPVEIPLGGAGTGFFRIRVTISIE